MIGDTGVMDDGLLVAVATVGDAVIHGNEQVEHGDRTTPAGTMKAVAGELVAAVTVAGVVVAVVTVAGVLVAVVTAGQVLQGVGGESVKAVADYYAVGNSYQEELLVEYENNDDDE